MSCPMVLQCLLLSTITYTEVYPIIMNTLEQYLCRQHAFFIGFSNNHLDSCRRKSPDILSHYVGANNPNKQNVYAYDCMA